MKKLKRCGKKEKLLMAAIKLITHRGVDKTTIDSIVNKADVGKGTFYRYFKDKKALIFEIIKQFASKLKEALLMVLNKGEKIENIDKKVFEVVLTFFKFHRENPELFKIVEECRLKFPHEFSHIIGSIFGNELGIFYKNIEKGIERGKLRAISKDVIFHSVLGILLIFLHKEFIDNKKVSKKQMQEISKLILYGIKND